MERHFSLLAGGTAFPAGRNDPGLDILAPRGPPSRLAPVRRHKAAPGEYRDSEGPILPPLEGEFGLISFFGEDGFLWSAVEPPVAEDERQPESLVVVAARNGTAQRAWAWYGEWWLLRGLTADRYLVGHMDDPSGVGGPMPVVVDLKEGTVVPIAGLPRSYEDSYTYPMELLIGSP